jgi:hypothetical protein
MKYYFVSYAYESEHMGGYGFGNCAISCERFLNVSLIEKSLEERICIKNIHIFIISFHELGKEEYDSFSGS